MSDIGTDGQPCAETNFVTAYKVERHFGGHEEGGWWWNEYEIIETVALKPGDDFEVVQDALTAKHKHLAWGNISSVNGGLKVWVVPEERAGEFETKTTPHYE